MSIKAYSDLFDMIEPYVPGCPIPVVLQNIQWAGREFCKRTERLTEDITLDTVADQRSYAIQSSFNGCNVKCVMNVRVLSETDVTKDYHGREIRPDYYEVIKSDGVSDLDSFKVACAGVPGAEGTYSVFGTEIANERKVYSNIDNSYVLFCGFIADETGVIYYITSIAEYEVWQTTGRLPYNMFHIPAPNTGIEGSYFPQGQFSGDCTVSAAIGNIAATLKFRSAYAPNESITDGLIVSMTVEPSVKTEGLPEWFLNEYADAIIAGTFWRLYALPNQPWSSPRDATSKQVEFYHACDSAKIDYLTRDLNGALTMNIEGYMS